MYSHTHLSQLVPERLIELERRLKAAIWSKLELPVGIEMTAPADPGLDWKSARSADRTRVTEFPLQWGPMWAQAWFKLALPPEAFAPDRHLFWDDEGEATLYIDGFPTYGFDSAHHRAPLPESPAEVWIEGICCRSAIWANDGRSLSDGGSRLREATLWQRDPEAWTVYWDFRVLLDLVKYEFINTQPQPEDWNKGLGFHAPMTNATPLLRRLLWGLDRFADAYDHDGFKAGTQLTALYDSLPARLESLDATFTGHAHIDLVWHWPERIGELKAVHSLAIANHLIGAYPELVFGYTQPASYEAVERRSPRLMQAVRDKIRTGSWEAHGACEVESDTQLPCGEALARSFIIGQERFHELRGTPSSVLWLPDVFGYSCCLPQIMRQTGVSYFFTTKLGWCKVNRFPYSSFRWIGHDGSEVVAHVNQENDYNGKATVPEIRTTETHQQQGGMHPEILLPTGYGDGGGGVTEEMLERVRRYRDLAGMPRSKWGSVEDFFNRLGKVKADLPEWKGELFLELHQGVQTTQVQFKKLFRDNEKALQLWEAVRVFTGGGPIDQRLWRRLVFAQFHDAITGTSIREVYDELGAELAEISRMARGKAAEELGNAPPSAVFNPLLMPMKSVTEDGVLDLRPLAPTPLAERRPSTDSVEAGPDFLKNRQVSACFTKSGEIESLEVDGHPVRLDAPLNQLWIYPDHPHRHPAWNIDSGTIGNGRRVESSAEVTVETDHHLTGRVSFSKAISERSHIVIHYELDAESDQLSITYDIDWQDEKTILKAVHPTAYRGRMARFGAPFGSTLRSQHPGELRAEAQYEVPGSRWALVTDDPGTEGLTLITESSYGFSAREGALGVTLLKSAAVLDAKKHLGIRTLSDANPFSDIGPSRIRTALSTYRPGAPREHQPAARAELFHRAPVPTAQFISSEEFPILQGGETLLPVWVLPEDKPGYTIRLNETMGSYGSCEVLLPETCAINLVDLQGNPLSEDQAVLRDRTIVFNPYALIGLRVTQTRTSPPA